MVTRNIILPYENKDKKQNAVGHGQNENQRIMSWPKLFVNLWG